MGRKRDLTLTQKIAVLETISKQPPNTTQRQLSEITGVPKSTISRLLVQQFKLLDEWALQQSQGTPVKRQRVGKYPAVEEALTRWFSSEPEKNMPIRDSILRCKAEEFADKLGHNEFTATDRWVARWKAMNSLKPNSVYGEKSSPDTVSGPVSIPDMSGHDSSSVTEELKSTNLSDLLQKFSADDIYNADEMSLFYRATPNGSLTYETEALSGKAMDRVTVLCCANMSGTDKKKLLVIGESVKPKCFEGINVDSLPVSYQVNENAWMTPKHFKRWLVEWDMELQKEQRNILLLLDNCIAHAQVVSSKNIQLKFLPLNTFLVQPMDMGIVKHLKTSYRAKLVNYILETIEENLLTSSSTAEEVGAKVNLLQAIQLIADSWRAINAKTIQNCFAHSGFNHSSLQGISHAFDSENDAMVEVQRITNYDDFLCIDNNIQCYDEDCKDEVVEEITATCENVLESQESGDTNMPEVKLVTDQDARKCIAGLRRYFMQIGNEGGPMSALDACADFVHLKSIKKISQCSFNEVLYHE